MTSKPPGIHTVSRRIHSKPIVRLTWLERVAMAWRRLWYWHHL